MIGHFYFQQFEVVSNSVSYALKLKSSVAEPLDLDRVLHTLQSCSETLVSIRH
jgi:hypothetical protein